MNTIYGVSPDRRTIYSAVALLIDLEYDISVYAFLGKTEIVLFCCDKYLNSDVIDRLGKKVYVSTIGEGKAAVTLAVACMV